MQKIAFIIVIAFFFLVSFLIGYSLSTPMQNEDSDLLRYETSEIFFNNTESSVTAELADTEFKRSRGLSGRESLEENKGMLFLFDVSGNHGFWMKEMLFSIDMIFIDADLKVVTIHEYVSPESFPKIFLADTPVLYVLEVRAGFAKKMGIKVDNVVHMSL